MTQKRRTKQMNFYKKLSSITFFSSSSFWIICGFIRSLACFRAVPSSLEWYAFTTFLIQPYRLFGVLQNSQGQLYIQIFVRGKNEKKSTLEPDLRMNTYVYRQSISCPSNSTPGVKAWFKTLRRSSGSSIFRRYLIILISFDNCLWRLPKAVLYR